MGALAIVSTGLSFLGAMKQAAAQKAAGQAQQQEANFEAAQLQQRAGQSRATAQRVAYNKDMQGKLAESRATAVQAANGGSTSDPTFVDIMGGLSSEAHYNSLSALYDGEEAARGDEMQSSAKIYEGNSAKRAGDASASATTLSAFGGLMKSGGSLMDKYAPSGTGLPYSGTAFLPSNGDSTQIRWN